MQLFVVSADSRTVAPLRARIGERFGAGIAYRQGDCMLDTWHCGTCGCTTHWTPVDPAYGRMAVNMRMFDPALWADLPRRFVDGASF